MSQKTKTDVIDLSVIPRAPRTAAEYIEGPNRSSTAQARRNRRDRTHAEQGLRDFIPITWRDRTPAQVRRYAAQQEERRQDVLTGKRKFGS